MGMPTVFQYQNILDYEECASFSIQGNRIHTDSPSQNLLRSDNYFLLTEQVDIKGINVLITSRERTFADMLDRPNLCGGIEEVWRSLKMTEYLNTENLLKYLRAL